LRDTFAAAAKDLNQFLAQQRATDAKTGADLNQALAQTSASIKNLNTEGAAKLELVEKAHNVMAEAKINAHSKTNLTFDGLKRDFSAAGANLQKKLKDIEEQIAKKAGGGITKEQLAEFKESFDHFDKSKAGALSYLDFKGALTSLGEDPSEEDFQAICARLDTNKDKTINFSEFIVFMSDRTKDKETPDEIIAAFKVLTDGREFITEQEMRTVMDADKAALLTQQMPKHAGGNGYDYLKWTQAIYA